MGSGDRDESHCFVVDQLASEEFLAELLQVLAVAHAHVFFLLATCGIDGDHGIRVTCVHRETEQGLFVEIPGKRYNIRSNAPSSDHFVDLIDG